MVGWSPRFANTCFCVPCVVSLPTTSVCGGAPLSNVTVTVSCGLSRPAAAASVSGKSTARVERRAER